MTSFFFTLSTTHIFQQINEGKRNSSDIVQWTYPSVSILYKKSDMVTFIIIHQSNTCSLSLYSRSSLRSFFRSAFYHNPLSNSRRQFVSDHDNLNIHVFFFSNSWTNRLRFEFPLRSLAIQYRCCLAMYIEGTSNIKHSYVCKKGFWKRVYLYSLATMFKIKRGLYIKNQL